MPDMVPDVCKLLGLPERTVKPRTAGITIVMDKGLGLHAIEDLMELAGDYLDYVKLGFGTACVSRRLADKIKLYQEAGVEVYLGGTCFEAFYVRGKIDEYRRLVDSLRISVVEVSDGSIRITHEEKCRVISSLSRNYRVLSEVGYKDRRLISSYRKWVELIRAELDAGARYVLLEGRESGTTGIFTRRGEVKKKLVEFISVQLPVERLVWEAPQKAQQVYFIKAFGANVNLANIAPEEVIALEALRVGLRGDTLMHFLKG